MVSHPNSRGTTKTAAGTQRSRNPSDVSPETNRIRPRSGCALRMAADNVKKQIVAASDMGGVEPTR